MEKFILRGYSSEGSNREAVFCLNLPKVKTFCPAVAVKNCEPKTYPEKLILNAVMRRKKRISRYEKSHIRPFAIIGDVLQHLPKTFQQLLSDHPFPISQGPIVVPLDTNTEAKETVADVLKAKTVFSHCDTQACGRWVPTVLGPAAWTEKQGKGNYMVTESDMNIQGVASLMDMSLVFTCQLSKCTIECPCHVCRVARNGCCKSRHWYERLKKSNSQCITHQIKLPYMFDAATDLYTMVTEKMMEYRFAYGYAGIPSNCKHCSADVLEHQVLHLVHHQLCRFCRYESRPLEQFKGRKSLKKFKKAEQTLNWRDNKTCSVCLKESKDKCAREKHEAIVHREECQKFKCDICPKSYVCQSSLDYHVKTHHQQIEKPTCELCGKQFADERSILRHKNNVHKTDGPPAEMLVCECGQKFSMLSNLKRHKREQHFDIKFNIDFHEGISPLKIFECENCDMTFKRKDHMRRHVLNAHSIKTLNCLLCDKKFARQDNLQRHVKSKH